MWGQINALWCFEEKKGIVNGVKRLKNSRTNSDSFIPGSTYSVYYNWLNYFKYLSAIG